MGKVGLLGLAISAILSVFTVRADRIYVMCYKDDSTCYVYDSGSTVYRLEDNGKLTELSGSVPIERAPALSYIPVHSDVESRKVTTNCYSMTFHSVCAFLTHMINDGYTMQIVLQTPSMMEGYLYGDSNTFRFIVMSDDTFRIYPEHPDVFSGTYPYLNEG